MAKQVNTNHQVKRDVKIAAGDPPEKLWERYAGVDNYQRPKADYLKRLQGMDLKAFFSETSSNIYMSARAASNPWSDFHWQCDACIDEATRRGEPDLYKKAWEDASGLKHP